METLYEKASLILNPGVYDTSKVYATKPFDGSGDLTFTRSNDTATRVASNGLIEKVRVNQYYKSTAFTTSSLYVTYGTSPVSTGTYPVDSSSLAYSFAITAPNQGMRISLPNSSSPRCFSIYLKDFGTVSLFSTGTATVLGTIADAGTINGYVRYVVTIGAGDRVFSIRPNNNTGTATTVFATAPQVELGDIPTAYIVNDTTSSVVSVGPVANVPRLDYLGSSCPRLLLEPQRTNLLANSHYLNGSPDVSNITITTNSTTSPEGAVNASKVVPNTSNTFHWFGEGVTGASAVYTQTIYAKADTYNHLFMVLRTDGGLKRYGVKFNLSTGEFVDDITFGSPTQTDYDIQPFGTDGWYRCSISSNHSTGTSVIALFGPSIGGNLTSINNEFAGDGTSGIYLYGAQLEAGNYATSLIPTYGAAVTRGADACIKENIAGTLPTAYPFTLFAEFEVTPAIEGAALTFSNIASPTEYFSIDHNSGFYRALSRPSGIISLVQSTTPATVGTHKICAVFTSTTIKLFVDGVLESSGANAQAFNALINDIIIGQLRSVGDTTTRNSVKQALVFKSDLSDADAIALTA
jgi:hypothetical protein